MKLRWYSDVHGYDRLQFNVNDLADKDDAWWQDVPQVWEDLQDDGSIVIRDE